MFYISQDLCMCFVCQDTHVYLYLGGVFNRNAGVTINRYSKVSFFRPFNGKTGPLLRPHVFRPKRLNSLFGSRD